MDWQDEMNWKIPVEAKALSWELADVFWLFGLMAVMIGLASLVWAVWSFV